MDDAERVRLEVMTTQYYVRTWDAEFVPSNAPATALTLAQARIRELETALEPAEGNDEIRDFWRQWAARRLEISRTYWLRASERALNGDMRELRLRVEQAKAMPAQIIASAKEAPDV